MSSGCNLRLGELEMLAPRLESKSVAAVRSLGVRKGPVELVQGVDGRRFGEVAVLFLDRSPVITVSN